MKKLMLPFIITLVLGSLLTQIVGAANHLSPASPSSKLVEELRKQLEEKVAPLKRQAYYGQITGIAKDGFIINTDKGKKTVVVTEGTKLVDVTGKTRKSIEFDALKVKDLAVGIGAIETDGTMGARIVLLVSPIDEQSRTQVVNGTITLAQNRQLTVENPKKRSKHLITVARNAKIQSKNIKNPGLKDLSKGNEIVALATMDKNKALTANSIYIISAGQENVPEATPSASPSPTP